MKRIHFFCIAAVLLLTGTVGADLQVYEYVPGEKVTLDTVTGNYWYWNLADFCNMNYDEQTAAISVLDTYGYIAGGWHMADADEMQTMWVHTAQEISQYYRFTLEEGESAELAESAPFQWGRYKESSSEGTHYTCWASWDEISGTFSKSGLPGPVSADRDRLGELGAWVVTQQPIVPAPAAIILAVTGLLSSTLGHNRLRRKQ